MAARAPQTQFKVLRIGILQNGRVVEEKRIDPGQTVTIGQSPKNTFCYRLERFPKRFPLFVAKGGRYALHFNQSMAGKVAHATEGVQELEQLRKVGKLKRKADAWILPLTVGNRGKITLGHLTVLFQFVTAPPQPLHATHKKDFRPRLIDEDDPVFIGFLGLFSLLATVFVIYVSSVPTPALLTADAIPDRFVEMVIPTATDAKDDDRPETEEGDGPAVKQEKEEAPVEEVKEKVERAPKTAEEKQAEEIRRRQELEQNVEEQSLLLKLIGTRGETSSNQFTEDLFADGSGVGQDLDQALREVSGVEVGTHDSLSMRQGGGAGTDRTDKGIGDLAKVKGGDAQVGSGPATQVSGKYSAGEIDVSSGDPGAVRSAVNRYSGQIKACYEQQLKSNPTLAGRVEVLWVIANGRATGVTLIGNSTGNQDLANCIVGKVRLWRFPTDLEPNMEVTFPFILAPG